MTFFTSFAFSQANKRFLIYIYFYIYMKDQSKLLTSRQKEILSLLRKGLTNSEICSTLNISTNTVKVHLANIYKTLEVTNRTEAVSTNIAEGTSRLATDDDIHIAITGCDGLSGTPLAKGLSLAIVEALHHYHLFRIKDSIESQPAPTYQIQVTGTPEKDENLFVTLSRGVFCGKTVILQSSMKFFPISCNK